MQRSAMSKLIIPYHDETPIFVLLHVFHAFLKAGASVLCPNEFADTMILSFWSANQVSQKCNSSKIGVLSVGIMNKNGLTWFYFSY